MIYIKKLYSVSDISKMLREFSSPRNHRSLGRDWVSSPALLTNSIGAFKIALLRKKCLRFFNHFAITRVAVGVKWKVFKQKSWGFICNHKKKHIGIIFIKFLTNIYCYTEILKIHIYIRIPLFISVLSVVTNKFEIVLRDLGHA